LYETVLGEKLSFTQDYIDNAAEMIGVLFEKGAVPEFEGYTLRKDGKIVLTLENNVLIYNDQKEAVASASILQDITENKQKERERENLIFELKEALKKVKTLSGMFPICSSCKKIRDDKGYWNQIESYVRDHSEAEFSHSLCPDCVKNFTLILLKNWRRKMVAGLKSAKNRFQFSGRQNYLLSSVGNGSCSRNGPDPLQAHPHRQS